MQITEISSIPNSSATYITLSGQLSTLRAVYLGASFIRREKRRIYRALSCIRECQTFPLFQVHNKAHSRIERDSDCFNILIWWNVVAVEWKALHFDAFKCGGSPKA